MERDEFKYVVFAFDTKTPKSFKGVKRSDGMIFHSKDDADVWIKESIEDGWADKFMVCRLYSEDIDSSEPIQLYEVESVGFKINKNSSLSGTQLDLF